MGHHESMRHRIHDFFENPRSMFAKLVQAIIFLLIILSLANLVIEYKYPDLYLNHKALFHKLEMVILASFTVEYVLRFFTAPKPLRWAVRPMNLVDFFAVFPTYLELFLHLAINTSSIRALRLIRVLRFARVLRTFKLFKFGQLFSKVLRYEDTILQSITPVIGIFVFAKAVIWILEAQHLWIPDPSLSELFAIIGFSLGIILSQKIGVTYDKFLQVEDAIVRIYGTLRSLQFILNKVEAGLGFRACHAWAAEFLSLLENPLADDSKINPANDMLYEAMSKAEQHPADFAMLHGEICRNSTFCLSKKIRVTPRAYDTLLHQSTMLYLALIVVFLPGLTGLISVVVATYILYGMYSLTEDLDSILGGKANLINVDISELKQFVAERTKASGHDG